MPQIFSGTDGTVPSSWTTAGRPTSPANGQFGLNTTLNQMEWYSTSSGAWIPFSDTGPYSVQYLVVAGGAAGGGAYDNVSGTAGGGGAGGYRSSVTGESSGGGGSAESALSVSPGTAYTVTVGAGGAAVTNSSALGTAGSNSVFGSITSVGGGGGGGGNEDNDNDNEDNNNDDDDDDDDDRDIEHDFISSPLPNSHVNVIPNIPNNSHLSTITLETKEYDHITSQTVNDLLATVTDSINMIEIDLQHAEREDLSGQDILQSVNSNAVNSNAVNSNAVNSNDNSTTPTPTIPTTTTSRSRPRRIRN
jgi:hypothetical protein